MPRALKLLLIGGGEQLLFLGILVTGPGFEGIWYLVRRTNAVTPAQTGASLVERCTAARTGRLQRVGGPGYVASDAPSAQLAGRHTIGAEQAGQ